MGSNDEVDAEPEYEMYRNREEWQDIIPIKQDDGSYSVVKIAYSETFEDVYDYFRAIVTKGELSKRSLELTEDAISMNAANYTVWQYRRKIIKHIKYDLETELDFCREMAEATPKNYQVWHHRRVIVEWLGDPSKELRFTAIILSADPKNYHAWEHRQWVLNTYNLFENELKFIEDLLEGDIRNNSAWNQRYFVISRTTGFSDEILEREIAFTMRCIDKLPNNESSWNYLRGILIHSPKRLSDHCDIEEWCLKITKSDHPDPCLAMMFLLDILEDKMGTQDSATKTSTLEQALQLCKSLSEDHDRIRKEYWQYTARRFAQKFE